MTTINNKKDVISLKCIKDGGRLRVRVITSGYHKMANCQFPRDIRKEGALYEITVDSIKLAKGPRGKYFYRVCKNNIKIVNDSLKNETSFHDKTRYNNIKVYGDDDKECIVCMDNIKDTVFVPCGHYCGCKKCCDVIKTQTGVCPMCRGTIDEIINIDQIG